MPYIAADERPALDVGVSHILGQIENWGQVNYVVTSLLHNLLEEASYEDYQAAIGVLECAKLELYRRQIAGYEDTKIIENGDVA